jgi:DNA-binding NarL/FixJ family response regulator
MSSTRSIPIRVMIVDHEDVVRRGFRAIIDKAPGLVAVAESEDGEDAVQVARKLCPDVVLIEINAGPGSFPDVIEKLRDGLDGTCRVLVLTSRDDDEALYLALRARVSGFLLKDVKEDDLLNAVRVVARGGAVISPAMTRRLIENFEILPPRDRRRHSQALQSLSDREFEVLCALVCGKSNQRIAQELHVASTTVKTHVSNVIAKLGVRTRIEAALLAREAGLPGVDEGQR